MKTIKYVFIIALGVAVTSQAHDQIPSAKQNHSVALVGGTIHPVSGPAIENGTIVFSGGKIAAMGADIAIPPGANQIDIQGKHVYPGLIDAYSRIGLMEIEAVRATNDIEEVGRINPNVRAEVAVNPESEIIPVTRANGVTTALVAPGGGTISGRSAIMMLDGWTWEDMILQSPAALHVNWPRMTTITAWWMRQSEEEQKKDREKSLQALSSAFNDARAYMVAMKAGTGKGIPMHLTDLRWEAMIPVLEKKIPVIVTAENIKEIQAAVAWAEKEDLRIVIWGGADAWRVTDLLKTKDIPVIVHGTHRSPRRAWEDYDTPFALPKKLHDAGVRFCIAGGGASNERNVPYQAATAAAYGLPKEEALRAVTLYPAQILGVADRVGSLEVGKDATLIVTTGDPLETTSNVELEYIQGRSVDLSSRHTELYSKYQTKYSQPSTPASVTIKQATE